MTATIHDVIHTIITAIPGAPFQDTVDTFKIGDPNQEVTGIVTTFLANRGVIQRAAELGANLIITHEPVFYNHLDKTDWLKGDPVYESKRICIEGNSTVIWRFHDYWHTYQPDGILTGVLKELGWENYVEPEKYHICNIPPVTFKELVSFLKEKLHVRKVRVVGNPDMICKRVGFLVGATGGQIQIQVLGQEGVDVLVCGESNEWDTCEYVRDAAFAGQEKALIILGHANSEEFGMKWLVDWLQPRVPGIKITHVPTGDPFRFV